jgi:hypothetical protein
MKDVSITELEAAINYYRNHSPTDEQVPILCREARVLADAYAMLIIRKKDGIQPSELNDSQKMVLEDYFAKTKPQ